MRGRDVLSPARIGPLGAPLASSADRRRGAIRAAFREQIEGLLEGGVDLLLLETFSDLDELLLAVDEAAPLGDLPVVASMTFGEELVAPTAPRPQAAAAALTAAGVDAVGVNCGVGPQRCLDALEQMGGPRHGGPPRSIMPNAGLPQRVEGQFVYAAGPPYFGERAAPPRRGRADRRRLLRHDAGAHRRACAPPSTSSRPAAGALARPQPRRVDGRRGRAATAVAERRAATAREPPPPTAPRPARWPTAAS